MILNNWITLFKSFPSWKQIERLIETLDFTNVLPEKQQVFNAFSFCSSEDVKVIIIGQDPYPNREDAHGLAFSSLNNKTPASLRNVFKELRYNINSIEINTNNITSWAKQGVLLLNSILTVQEGVSNSHRGLGWEEFTTDVLKVLISQNRPLVIMAWGKIAQDKLKELSLHDKILVLKGGHPSPLNKYGGFLGGNYFVDCDEFLVNNGLNVIDWALQ